MRRMVGLVVLALVLAACASAEREDVTVTPGSVPAGSAAEEFSAPDSTTFDPVAPVATTAATSGDGVGGCADVIGVEISGDGPYTFAVTVSSPDTGWDKYADEWRIESEAGDVLGVRELAHPHVDEQPFTRSLGGVEVEAGSTVVVAARDSVEGYCGERLTVIVEG